ncbi:site-specific recombinase XerD [Dysgonomonas alginatilytica]|uniref:Site-specific recombinase XerD n=1 Tax=Dysgonomonas alginatilytica TaxID=1605892 RepID=A0A2V3PKZ6_9BACT|nr:site-specific integrase [Dysgonomonas alginatilytica]PXV60124.1 site-specific recombinase XerD [Dysgonomonas alginatilytica]
MNNKLKVSFYLKRESRLEKNNAGENVAYPIIGKIIIGNSIAQFSSKLSVTEHLWHVKSGRAVGKSRVAVELNREINKINLLIHSHYKDILERTGTVTAIDVKNAYQGIASTQKTLLVLFEEMMREFQTRIGIDRSASTYQNYQKTYKHLKSFIRGKYKIRDISLCRLDLPFIEAFDFYLRVECGLMAGSAITDIIYLQKVARIALNRNLINRPPFGGFKPEKPEIKTRSLTKEELERFISTPLPCSKLCFIRDMFVFSSFTGISYADLKKLTCKEIITEKDGSLWICSSRQKTGVPFNVKLLDIPIQIIEKYRGCAEGDYLFCIPTQTTIGNTLKTIATHCKIDKNVTYHQSRHSFASQICLSQGVPIESVSKMLGHRDIRTTQRYARVNNEKIGNDMKQLSIRLTDKFDYPTSNR